jgi:DNA (cytosine-5)-methyltransferase 1
MHAIDTPTPNVLRRSVAKLGLNKDAPRVYLQGKWLAKAGFATGEHITAAWEGGTLTLALDAEGERKVSGKKKGTVPVIDIAGQDLREVFGFAESLEVVTRLGTITITPSKTERHKARRVRNGKEGSVFAGGGLLTEAAGRAGFRCAWAVEIDARYAEHFEARHPEAVMHNMSVHEVDGSELEQVELMTVGLPCEPFSTKRRAGRGAVPEDHSNGDLVYWALRLIEEVAPYTVVIEEVPAFLTSGAGFILMGALRRMGYNVEAKVVNPADYGELAGRRRAVVIATTDAEVAWPEAVPTEHKLAEILDEIPEDDERWFDADSKAWLFNHWAKQVARGNNFISQILTPETTRVNCISKRYFNGQGDGAVVKHPTKAGTYRWLTVDEVSRLHGLPTGYMTGLPKTTAGEIIGQGVIVPTFALVVATATGRVSEARLAA